MFIDFNIVFVNNFKMGTFFSYMDKLFTEGDPLKFM